jgi:hypothetical protein
VPEHIGPLLVAVTSGNGLTTTFVIAVFWHPKILVTVSEYAPSIKRVAAPETSGFLWFEIKPFGPLHKYDDIPMGPPVRLNGAPTHTGPLLAAVTAGRVRTTTAVVAVFWHPKLLVTVREYVPAISAVAAVDTTGFCRAELKLFGPLQA